MTIALIVEISRGEVLGLALVPMATLGLGFIFGFNNRRAIR